MRDRSSPSVGATPIDAVRAFESSVLVLFLLVMLGNLGGIAVSSAARRQSMYWQDWFVASEFPPLGNFLAMLLVVAVWAACLGFGYALVQRDLPGKRVPRGIVFGLAFWGLSLFSEMATIVLDRIPSYIHIVWISSYLPISLVVGIALSGYYPRDDRPGDSAGVPAHLSIADACLALSEERVRLFAASGLCLVWLGAVSGMTVVLFKPFDKAPWLFNKDLVAGRYPIHVLVYSIGIGLFLSTVFTLFYTLVYRGLPWRGAGGGAFFGVLTYMMFLFPYMAVFFAMAKFSTEFLLLYLIIPPLVMFTGMGTICGLVSTRFRRSGVGA